MAEEAGLTGGARTAGRNRNAQRSVRMLREALLELLGEKPYDKITVTDVTRKADLNRGTFYAHFSNVDDLARDVMDEITFKISNLIEPQMGAQFFRDPRPTIDMVGRFLQENRAMLQPLVNSHSLESFFDSVVNRIRVEVQDHLTKDLSEKMPFALIAADYLAGGIIGTYKAWVMGEYGDVTMDELDEGICQLVRATGAAVGVVDAHEIVPVA